MVYNSDIMPALMRLRYKDHHLLALEDVTKDLYLPIVLIKGIMIERIHRIGQEDWTNMDYLD